MDRVLVVDDDPAFCHVLTKALAQRGYEALACRSGREARVLIAGGRADLVLLDNRLSDGEGLELLGEIGRNHPKVWVIIMTAFGTAETAIESMRLGAFDYILKPFELDEICKLVDKGVEAHRRTKEAGALQTLPEYSDQIVGKSRAMQSILKLIGQVAGSDVTVLIRGESGTGKELVAKAIYLHSRRRESPFLAINCAAIPEPLLESELFGHERGAFTGADRRQIGKFEQCDGGTILLDEIGDMSLSTQAKILRVLQEGEFERVGGCETVRVNVRILTSTNRNLEGLMREGRFREDLYYRLKILSMTLPPLRERKEDIKELTEYFFQRHNRLLGKKIYHIDSSVFDKLASWLWPGNVRELENTVNRSLILCKGGVLTGQDIVFDTEAEPLSLADEEQFENALDRMLDPLFTDIVRCWRRGVHSNFLAMIDKLLVQRAFSETKRNQTRAAKLLGISRNTLRNRMERYNLST